MDWRYDTISLTRLWDLSEKHNSIMGAIAFLKLIEVIPESVEWKRGNAIPKTNLNADAIPAGYLAEVAYDWDKDGPSAPWEFVDAIAAECNGTEVNTEVSDVLGQLGRS
jgi:hypothetical protein